MTERDGRGREVGPIVVGLSDEKWRGITYISGKFTVSQFPRLNDRMGRLGDTFDDVSKGSSVQLIGEKNCFNCFNESLLNNSGGQKNIAAKLTTSSALGCQQASEIFTES